MVNWEMIGAMVFPNIGGWVGTLVNTKKNMEWYENLNKPGWRPPNWLFGPVWTGLYTSMGYASYIVYRDGGGFNGPARMPLMLFGTQLALNWAWTPIFFGMHHITAATAEITILMGVVIACTASFWPINRTASYLMLPYIAWGSFATALMYSIWNLNKDKID